MTANQVQGGVFEQPIKEQCTALRLSVLHEIQWPVICLSPPSRTVNFKPPTFHQLVKVLPAPRAFTLSVHGVPYVKTIYRKPIDFFHVKE